MPKTPSAISAEIESRLISRSNTHCEGVQLTQLSPTLTLVDLRSALCRTFASGTRSGKSTMSKEIMRDILEVTPHKLKLNGAGNAKNTISN